MTRWLREMAIAATLGFGVILLTNATNAEPAIFDDWIVFGQCVAFEGPALALGVGIREGPLASFNEGSTAGGVKGRRLELVSRDDGVVVTQVVPFPWDGASRSWHGTKRHSRQRIRKRSFSQ
jgi:hypothetical protein